MGHNGTICTIVIHFRTRRKWIKQKSTKFKKILTFFNNFNTSTKKNFQNMIKHLQFPFVYNEYKIFGKNRLDFKEFYQFLTNVRCAVIEGSHCCEAASQVLQNYRIGDPVPLASNPRRASLPPSSTIFRPVPTWLYYCKNQKMLLDDHILSQLKKISEQIANCNDLIVPAGWDCFFTSLLDNIN